MQIFEKFGVRCKGFRSPYLRWTEDTLSAVKQESLLYDGSQGLAWDLGIESAPDSYNRVLDFYRAESASRYPSTPSIKNGLVCIPYCLPDDEALVERFQYRSPKPMSKIWLSILHETFRLGELFTLGLHPERIYECEEALRDTLNRAKALSPKVWFARLDDIAQWWLSLNGRKVFIENGQDQEFRFTVDGPKELVYLTRGVENISPTKVWDDNYLMVADPVLIVRSNIKPFIGVSQASPEHLTEFLHQQGYIFERAQDGEFHSIFLDFSHFCREDERDLLQSLEGSTQPLVKMGRWPHGARSALCVTGDIDALTLWDYGLRVLGS
jgi:hypothetical protein